MRRLSATFFLILYLASTTQAGELLKLPVILQHYNEHLRSDKHMSLLAFLDMHYMHGSPHDDDYDRDMQLPFKKADHRVSYSPVQVPPAPGNVTVVIQPLPVKKFIVRDVSQLYSHYHHSIFQPPRS